MKEICLVTGGLGFIGSNLVDKLIGDGHSVFVIDDLSTGVIENKNPKANYLIKDLCEFRRAPDDLKDYIKKNGIKVVFHLAASADVNYSMRHPDRVFEINLLSSIVLLNCCEKAGVEKFVFSSTSAVYGEPKYLPVNEEHQKIPISVYGLTKLNFEQFIYYHASNSSLMFSIFRFPNVYGKRQRSDLEGGVVAIFNNLIECGKPLTLFGDGQQTRDWVHVDDIVNAISRVFTINFRLKIINFGSGIALSLTNLIEVLQQFYKSEITVTRMPARRGDIKHMVLDPKLARETLNWEPQISINDGIKKLKVEN